MTLPLTPENTAALQARALVPRDLVWFVAHDRETGDPVTDGMWSGTGTRDIEVLNPETGDVDTRTFYGAGTLIQMSDIPRVRNITVQTVTIQMSQVDDRVAQLVRDYEVRQARVEVYRALFNPATRHMVSPAFCRFVGFVDELVITTPKENEEGSVVLTCVSHTQEMTRSNPDTRSDASQRLRSATDNFFADASVVGDWEHFWGTTSGAVATVPAKTGLLGLGGFLGFL